MAGADYINADAINQIEMWSGDTYNHDQIDKEPSWAEGLDFKTLRVYLSSVVYENDPEGLKQRMDDFLTICQGHVIRPLICTEYMARRNNSLFQTIMPMLKAHKVAAINWGFVAGKTNAICAWDEPLPDLQEHPLWFHDIYRQDGTPFSQEEVDSIKALTKD